MLFVEEEAFYSKITFLTLAQRSKVTPGSKSYGTLGLSQYSFGPSMVEIHQSLTELEAFNWLPEKRKKKERTRQKKDKTA